jgi:hypothetical protein
MFTVRPSSDFSKGVPPSLPQVIAKVGGGTITIIRRSWASGGRGFVVGYDSGGTAWRLNADGFAELDT